jgi:hypothetical protein
VSPTLVTSDIGVPGAIAPGIASPSSFTFSPISRTSAPPADVPKNAMFCAGMVFSAAFQTVMPSSSAAGK